MSQHRPTRRSRSSKNWKSSVVGSHANNAGSWGTRGASARGSHGDRSAFSHRPPSDRRSAAARTGAYGRGRSVSIEGRTAELHQMRPSATPVDPRGSRRRPADPAELIRRRKRSFFTRIGVIAVVVVLLAFGLGGFVFQNVVGGNMSIKDPSVKSALVAPENDTDPYYVLLAGSTSDQGEASYLAVLRVDPQNNKLSLLNVPANIAASTGELRDLPNVADGGTLVTEVSNLLGAKISHYVALSDEGLVSLVDALGGIDVNIAKTVDDPRAGTVVLDPGQQTLDGKEALTYVRAYNYENGREGRAEVQSQFIQAVVSKLTSKEGLDFMKATDALSNGVQTDLSYDELMSLMNTCNSIGSVQYGTIPGADVKRQGRVYFGVTETSWAKVQEQFLTGGQPSIDYTTTTSEKKKLSIIVLNGSGITGNAQKAEEKLKAAGYTVKETGNAESFVYEETLVVYRSSKNQEDAQAIVDQLGVGRAVAAGVNYNLSTDIQVMVGKDWVS